jgi:colicin import membrane protein
MPFADNVRVSALDENIDDLYRQPLSAFTGARNALAKSLSGDEAKRVRALVKPAVVPWAVNQVYWRARPTYERVMKSGERLRAAQIDALEGKSADVRGAAAAHRRAIAEAVAEAERQAAAAGSKPAADALMRTFEALSLASEPPDAPGRLTGALQPAGFEALAGVKPQAGGPKSVALHEPTAKGIAAHEPVAETRALRGAAAKKAAEQARQDKEREAREARQREEAARAARARDAALRKADAHLARVEAAEQQARAAWERAHDELLRARQAVSALKRNPDQTS